jgi:diguanylate cyclase (GGDEF)-like protein
VMFFNLIVVVYFLAGPLGGVSVVMIFVVPLFAFVLLGLKPGVVWAALTYAMLMIGGVMEVRGYVFPNIDNTPYASVGKIIHLNVSFFTIFIMVAFYEINGRRYRAQLEEVALNDGLTQLPNRSAFYTVIAAAIEKHQQSQAPFTLIYMDIDNFKRINDKFGHGAGDQVLRAFAGRLKSSVRAQDFVCRLGGDEFAILVEGPDERVAQLILGRLEGQLKESVGLRNEQCIFVSASTGMAYYPHDATSLEAILHAADERMYLNKRESKRVQTAEPPVDPSLMRSSAYAALSALGRSEPF